MLVQASELSHFFGKKQVLKKVSFSVDFGDTVLVCGPNGSGKTTLLKLVAGLLSPSAGRIELELEQKEIGYLGHSPFVYSGLSALENLKFWKRIYGLKSGEKDLHKCLQRVGLARYRHERAGSFSRGMSQRLGLARLIMLQSRLLLLDEPGTGLDFEAKELLRQEILEAKVREQSVFLISHNWEEDLSLADWVLYLSQGEGRFADKKDFQDGGFSL